MSNRHLARSNDGMVIHRRDCRHARIPWYGADRLTDDELWSVKMVFGYRVCKVCEPSWRITENDDEN